VGSGAHKTVLAQKRCKIGPKLLLRTNRRSICAFDWHQIYLGWPWAA